jgi:hypothetical protein
MIIIKDIFLIIQSPDISSDCQNHDPWQNLILKGRNKHKARRYFVYIQHVLFYLLCLPPLYLFWKLSVSDACRENDILIKSSWDPSTVLMIVTKFWYPRKWSMISSDKSDDPPKFLNVSSSNSADILES